MKPLQKFYTFGYKKKFFTFLQKVFDAEHSSCDNIYAKFEFVIKEIIP